MKTIRIPLAVLAVFILSACEKQAVNETAPETVEPEVVLDTREERISYGIAYGLGQRLKSDDVPLDVAAFAEGLRHAFDGREPLLSQQEIGEELEAFQQEQGARREAQMQEIADRNAADGAAFLAQNAEQEGVVVLESGLQYKIVEQGEGAVPTASDTVEVHYRGTLIDGTEFDSSYARGQTVQFGVGQVIPGWTEALQLMPKGSKWQLFIPSNLAYGPGGAGPQIGPNSTLVFDVELIDVVSAGEVPVETDLPEGD